MQELTVKELREALEGVSDELPVGLSSDTGVAQGIGEIIIEKSCWIKGEDGWFDIRVNDHCDDMPDCEELPDDEFDRSLQENESAIKQSEKLTDDEFDRLMKLWAEGRADMQKLEKILKEMKRIKDGNRKENLYAKYPPNGKDQEVLNAYSQGYEDGIDNFYNVVSEIIRKHMKNEEDILKFYYCESEDDYYIGQRVQNRYYARYADGGFAWFMSRHLPWGEHVVAPETAWKEYTYPSEPKEIPFMEWIEGFIQKHMNDKDEDGGWIPVEERLPEEKINPVSQDFYEYQVMAKFGNAVDVRYYKYGHGHWWHGAGIVDKYVIAWRENPEPYC